MNEAEFRSLLLHVLIARADRKPSAKEYFDALWSYLERTETYCLKNASEAYAIVEKEQLLCATRQ